MRPGDLLRDPLALGAVALLLINDHVLKAASPGFLTGKLSDVAGLVFFPLLLAELLLIASRLTRRPPRVQASVAVAIATTAVGFTLAKTTVLGGSAFAVALGGAQWLLTAGPFTGGVLRPVAFVVDPTDLLALPALVLAWRIAHRTSHRSVDLHVPTGLRWPSTRTPLPIFGLLIIAVAAFSSLATSPSQAPDLESTVVSPVTLDVDRPVVTRHLTWKVADADEVNAYPWVQLDLAPSSSVGDPRSSDVEITLVPDRGVDIEPSAFADDRNRSWDLTAACRTGCEGGATVLVRLRSGVDVDAEFDLESLLIVRVSNLDTPAIELHEDIAMRADGVVRSVARLDEAVTVSDDRLERTSRAVLRVAAAALDDPLAFPLVGQISARVEIVDGAGAPEAHEAWIAMDLQDPVWFTADSPPVVLDWLAHCQPNRDCELEIQLFSRYDPTLDGTVDQPDPDAAAFVTLQWNVEARLEAFDGRSLPADAVILEILVD